MLAGDHARLDRLLDEAAARDPAKVEPAPYDAFRRGLLKHIGMEEKILLPAAQQLNGGEPMPLAARLRLDHGAIAALLVPSPTPTNRRGPEDYPGRRTTRSKKAPAVCTRSAIGWRRVKPTRCLSGYATPPKSRRRPITTVPR